jgi:hypothetical protein
MCRKAATHSLELTMNAGTPPTVLRFDTVRH